MKDIYLIISVAVLLIGAVIWTIFVYKKRIENKLGLQYKQQIQRHYEETKNIYTTMRGWRHDFHNHIQTIKGHIALEQYKELDDYLDKLDMDLTLVDTKIKTGNIMADAIISSKVSLAESRKITVNVKAAFDKKMTVSEIDLCVIVGNLMDNAIDACMSIADEKKRFIRVYIGKLKQQLYISISNSTAETLRNDSGVYVSKKGGVMHGHGLRRVDTAVQKYDGYLNRQNEPGVFATEILLPL